jgi:ketosteroid isomerase-like protein
MCDTLGLWVRKRPENEKKPGFWGRFAQISRVPVFPLCFSQAHGASTMTFTEKRNLRLIDRWIELWNAKNLSELCEELFDKNYVLLFGGLKDLRGYEKRLAGEELFARLAPDRKCRLVRAMAQGDVVAYEVQADGTDARTGEPFEMAWSSFSVIRNGKIVSESNYMDTAMLPPAARLAIAEMNLP